MMRMNKNKGFTLIEILIALVIIGLVLTALFNINLAGFKFLAYNQDRVELQNQARIINNNFERQIRKASDIEINSNNEIVLSGGNIKIYVKDDVAKPWQLKLENSGNVRNITDNVISDYHFEMEDTEKGLLYFDFQLMMDISTYEIHNRFYPRAKN